MMPADDDKPVRKRAEPGAESALNDNALDSHTSYELGDELDLSVVLRQVLSITMRSVNASSGSVLLLDEGGWASHWFVTHQDRSEFVSTAQTRRAITERGITSWVIQQRQGDLINDLASDPRWRPSVDFPVRVAGGRLYARRCWFTSDSSAS